MAESDKTAAIQSKSRAKVSGNATKLTTTKKSISTSISARTTTTEKAAISHKKPQISATAKLKPTATNASKERNIPTTVKRNVNTTKTTTTPRKIIPPAQSVATIKSKAAQSVTTAKSKLAKSSQQTNQPTKINAVLNTPHNVTVISPPMQRKSKAVIQSELHEVVAHAATKPQPMKKVLRTGSRTLEPDEIVVLRRESAKKRFEESVAHVQRPEQRPANKSPIRPAIAFDVNFDDGKQQAEYRKSASENEYSDDCESSFSSHSNAASISSNESSDQQQSDDDDDEDDNNDDDDAEDDDDEEEDDNNENEWQVSDKNETEAEESDAIEDQQQVEDDDESQLTPYPSTVIFKERKLDSGNYDAGKNIRTTELDNSSLDTISAARSEHFDSGISNYSNYAPRPKQEHHKWAVCYCGYAEFVSAPIVNRRGRDLMAKIRKFDDVSFGLFELKPISYEIYMQNFGNLNAVQAYAQTAGDDRISRDCQTDEYILRNMWTQHPPIYDRQSHTNLICGIGNVAPMQNLSTDTVLPMPRLQNSRQHIAQDNQRLSRKPFTYEKLNAFLLKSSSVLAQIFEATNNKQLLNQNPNNTNIALSANGCRLNTEVLNALRVVNIFASNRHNIIITVHESLPDVNVYSADFSNLLMVWSGSDFSDKPIRLLSTWSEVCRAEICYDYPDIIVCGLRDGSVALWNLQETHSYCSKLDGCLTHFAATHSIVPTYAPVNATDERKLLVLDLGATVDVKSFRTTTQTASTMGLTGQITGKSVQFVSLHDNGLLTIWTLVKNTVNHTIQPTNHHKLKPSTTLSSRFEFSSPWAQVKLIQSTTCDLRSYLERSALNVKTQFEKTRALFQRNIGNDEARLQLTTADAETLTTATTAGLRFTALDVGVERIYVCSNRNFVLSCSRSLKWERICRIVINESRFLFLTAIRVLTNEHFIAIGLTNGAVMVVNCSPRGTTSTLEDDHADAAMMLRKSSAASNAKRSPPVVDVYSETGKSCAIQNIILNEKMPTPQNTEPEVGQINHVASKVSSTSNNPISATSRSFDRRVCDQLFILNGSDLRENLVQSLELSRNGERLFVLSNNKLRVYDFIQDVELKCDMCNIIDLAMTRVGLLTLNLQNHVELQFTN